MRKKSVKFTENFDVANASMNNLGLPEDIIIEARNYMLQTFTSQDKQNEMI